MPTLKEKILACTAEVPIEYGIAIQHVEKDEITEINGDVPFPTASVFKVPVMVEVFRQARQGLFDLNDRLELKDKDKTLTTGVLLNLQEGLMLTVRDLMMLMNIVSDNVATTMLMDLVGAKNITQTMHSLGLHSISIVITVHEMFLHAFGIPDRKDIALEELRAVASDVEMDYGSLTFARTPDNNVSTAIDMTRLMAMIQRREILDQEACDEMLDILRNQQYNNRVPRYLPWRSVAHKTGTMRGLRNDSGVITCGDTSHAAFSVFTFDPAPPGQGTRQEREMRSTAIEKIMGEIGLAVYEHYKES